MNLEEFVKNVLVDIDKAVESARQGMRRDIHFSDTKDQRTVEFDIAVSAESVDTANGKAGIRVLKFVEGGADIGQENRNSTVSRIKFGIHIDSMTKSEEAEHNAMIRSQFKNSPVSYE